MADSPDQPSPMAVAMEWVSRITSIALAMVVPGLVGFWIDGKFGTSFIGLVGLVLGFAAGMWGLLAIAKGASAGSSKSGSRKRDQS